MKAVLPVLILLGLTACGSDATVGGDAQLLVPDDVTLHWDASFNGVDDGRALLLPVDVMVYQGGTGEPIEGATIQLGGTDPGAMLLRPDAVQMVGPDQPVDGAWWDAWSDRYFAFAPDMHPTSRLVVDTDATGLARVYVFVDRFPVDDMEESGFAPAPVRVTMGETEESFLLIPR